MRRSPDLRSEQGALRLVPIDALTSRAADSKAAFSLVIPARNEASRIAATLEDYVESLPHADIIVVLNGCTDGTRKIVESYASRHPSLRTIEIRASLGKGGAVLAGSLHSGCPIIAYVDADGSTSGKEIDRLVRELGDADAIIGSRWLPGASVYPQQSATRRFISRGFNLLVRALFGLPFTDTQCGAKVFRAEVLHEALHWVQTSTLAFDVDILYVLQRRGKRVREVPTTWSERPGSTIRIIPASAQMLSSVLRMRLRYSALRTIVPIFDRLFPTQPIGVVSRLKILILNWRDITHPQAGGAETYLHEMAKRWVEGGSYVTWLTAGYPGAAKQQEIDGVNVIRVGNAFSVYALAPLEYIAKLRNQFDIVVDAENGIPFFSPLFSLKRKRLLMFHVHRQVFLERLPFPISWFFVWIETAVMPWLYRSVDFVAISEDTKAAIERYRLTRRPIDVIHSGVDARLVPGRRSATPLIVSLGRVKAYKRVDWLIESFARVHAQVPAARLIVAGAGDDLDRCRALAASLGLGDACEFTGYVDEARKRELLQSAWVFASASSIEGWGIAAIEANACATPAVVFDVPGLREAVIDGVNGLVVRDRQGLDDALLRVLTDRALRERLEAGSLERSRAFSWDTSAREFLTMLMRDTLGAGSGLIQIDGNWVLVSSVAGQKQ